MKPSAKIILDSISPSGVRLTTMEVVMHRYVLAKFNTHRVFSRNSAFSGAIPVNTIIERVSNNPALPINWGSNKPGMQVGEELLGQERESVIDEWNYIKSRCINSALVLKERGLHKQVANRILEPFMWHTVIVTATEWDNFFWQRCSPLAQPEMKAAADEMQLAYYTSEPNFLDYGQWHLPYVDDTDFSCITEYITKNEHHLIEKFSPKNWDLVDRGTEIAKQISTARCARVSVLNHDGKREIEKDIGLFNKLRNARPIHISPFEHVATPLTLEEVKKPFDLKLTPQSERRLIANTFSGNFRGWKQFRKEIPNENLTKFIPNLPELKDVAKKLESKFNNR